MMSKKCLALILIPSLLFILAVSVVNSYASYQSSLSFTGYLQDANGDIDAGDFSVPLVYDWNSDGIKDLLVGSRTGTAQTGYHGYVSFYENIGTNSSPVFGSSSYIQACSTTCSALDVSMGTGG